MAKFQVMPMPMPMPIPSYHPHDHTYHAAGHSTSHAADNSTISPYPTPPPQPAQFVSHAVETAVLGDGSSSSPSQHTSSSYSKVCPDPSLPLLDTSIYAFPQQQEQDSGYYQAMQEYYVEWYQRYGYPYPPDPSCGHPMPTPMPMASNHADSRHVPHSLPSYPITPITPQYHFADSSNVSTPPVYGDDWRSMGAGNEAYASKGKPSSAHRNGKGWWTDPPGGQFFQQDFKSQEYGALGAVQQGSTRRSKQRSRSEVRSRFREGVHSLEGSRSLTPS
jgi:hypothetical protein